MNSKNKLNDEDTYNKNSLDSSSHINETNQNLIYRNYVISTFPSNIKKKSLNNNKISTSKYTWYNCIPKILFEQFTKVANIYFLIIAIMQSIPAISISNGKPLILVPLITVISINGIKNFVEDLKRKRSDQEENNREVEILKMQSIKVAKQTNNANNKDNLNNSILYSSDSSIDNYSVNKNEDNMLDKSSYNYHFKKSKWENIFPGDIIRVRENQYFPADMIIISSSDNGHCYVETKNLDGETSLKYKKAVPCLHEVFNCNEGDSSLRNLNADIKCKKPDDNIYTFDATIEFTNNLVIKKIKNYKKIDRQISNLSLIKHLTSIRYKNYHNSNPQLRNININLNNNESIYIDKDNFILRGCSLKQTQFVVGVVVYAGHSTKIMKNSPKPKNKISKVEKLMHKQILYILILQIILSIIATVLLLIWLENNQNYLKKYIFVSKNEKVSSNLILNSVLRIGTWILIFTNLVPISLLVTMEMIKLVQGMFISWDKDLYDKTNKLQTKVQTSTLNEELGQVNYIFTDKTGTLTKNFMEFKKLCVGFKSYGKSNNNSTTIDQYKNSKNNFNDNCVDDISVNINKSYVSNVKFYDDQFDKDVLEFEKDKDVHNENKDDKTLTQQDYIKYSLLNMAMCHSANSNFDQILLSNKENYLKEEENKSISSIKSKNSHLINQNENLLEFLNNNIKDLKIISSSPDEKALINFAKFAGYEFLYKDDKDILYIKVNGKVLKYQLLDMLEYSSERKKMSVIVKLNTTSDNFDKSNKVIVLTKGADSVIISSSLKMSNSKVIENTKNCLLNYAREGLRTLTLSYKEISMQEYNNFNSKKTNLLKEGNNINELENLYKLIEDNQILLGGTAIEDHLQDNVEAVLNKFILTGIKVWMLTGDKIDTAKSIAFSCKLITHEFNLFELSENLSYDEISKCLTDNLEIICNDKLSNTKIKKKFALIIGMDELSKIFGDEILTSLFYELSHKCNTVLCCRVTPKQKAQVVKLIKIKNPNITTLAVGDGANDVNMITSADIGIGILGKEGMQASRASDYSIGQFQFLSKLLYVHGREIYRKNSFVVVYNFYKNVLFVAPQFFFGIFSMFSGQTLYDPWIYQLYNIIFTSMPIIWYGVFDTDINYKKLEDDYNYYKQGMVGFLFNPSRFWKHVLTAFVQSFIIFYLVFEISRGSVDFSGRILDLWAIGSIVYLIVVIISNLRVLVSTRSHTIYSLLIFLFSIMSYYIVLYIMSKIIYMENFNNFNMVVFNVRSHLLILICVFLCIIFDYSLSKLTLLFGILKNPYNPNINKIISDKKNKKNNNNLNNFNETNRNENNNYLGFTFSTSNIL